jgi:hypothetical protein
MQRKWYRSVLEKDLEAVNGGSESCNDSFILNASQVSQGRRMEKLA